ncbi:MAG: hypothetical protein ABIN91_18660 [Mucilaginibacter sp.]|uniref:hypothetical protein n=1 Tax=Mucilaginibacter sp. TaxID=1882438 RepID=UPI0032675E8D
MAPNQPATITVISPEMQHIYDAVKNHVTMKTSGALLVTGDWGSGKTFYMKNILFPKIEQDTAITPIIVSLYGATDKAGIASKVLFAYLDKMGKDKLLSAATLTKGVHNILESATILKKYVDVNKLFASSGEELFRFLPKDKLLICFDDLERISNKINPEDFLGMVNELVENKGNRVLIIANEGFIEGGIKFKEKTIEKTVHFSNDMAAIFDSLLLSYTGTPFHTYLTISKDFILNSINFNHNDDETSRELKIAFANIRTFKFAIEHFRLVFETIQKSLDTKDLKVQNKLHACWLFVLSISVEFKKPNSITFSDRKHLDMSIMPFNPDDIASILGYTDEETAPESDFDYRNSFIDKYYKRISEPFVYLPEVYNLITAGHSINQVAFLADLDTSFTEKKPTTNPAQELLSKFLHQGYWNFTDQEFKAVLYQLLEYGEQGKYDNGISYLNAGVYLLNFSSILELSKEVITEKLKSGLKIHIKEVNNSFLIRNELDMASGNFQEEHLQQLVTFIKEQFVIKEKEEITSEALQMEELFVNNVSEFVKELVPKNPNMRSPDKLLFNQFNDETIEKALKNWQPADIMNLTSYFKIRYLDPSFAERLTAEIPFLESLREKLLSYSEPNKLLSAHLITEQTIPRLTQCINKLNTFDKNITGEQF